MSFGTAVKTMKLGWRFHRPPWRVSHFSAQKKIIEAKGRVTLPPVPHVIPECVHRLVWVQIAQGVGPTLLEEPLTGRAAADRVTD
jgi:hypothetical protein